MPRDHDIMPDADHMPGDAAQAGTGAPARPKAPVRRLLLGAAALAVAAAAGWGGWHWWTVGRHLVSTDDAYVTADFAILSPKVSGYVAEAPAENAAVAAGAVLVRLEDGDYRAAFASAEAALSAAEAAAVRAVRQVEVARAAVAQSEAQRDAALARLAQAEADLTRYSRLAANDYATGQTLDAARAARDTAAAAVAEAEAGIVSARASVAVAEAQRREADAAVAKEQAEVTRARRDLDATAIRAPFEGTVGNLAVTTGDYVTPGKRLLAVVPLGRVYVEANFKETQIARLVPGTPVTLTADAFPDHPIEGHVESLSPASGAVFSLLPPENATGNFTKVVQRVPVRVSVPAAVAAEGWLRPGLSVTAVADPDGVRGAGALAAAPH